MTKEKTTSQPEAPTEPFDAPLLHAGVKQPSIRRTALELALQHHIADHNKMGHRVIETAKQFETYLRGDAGDD